ncbi:MAG: c-type cytochrome [Acetobacteraceae bacterium]|nr:c-type cytochrome [Acetobacteraceae bacterium]
MNSFELNKIAAAVLTALFVFLMSGFIGELLVHPKRLEKSVLAIDTGRREAPAQAAAPAAPAIDPIAPLLASANVENGAAIARRQCASCHSFDQGGRHGVGPNLWGIVGADHAHAAGFNYSASRSPACAARRGASRSSTASSPLPAPTRPARGWRSTGWLRRSSGRT